MFFNHAWNQKNIVWEVATYFDNNILGKLNSSLSLATTIRVLEVLWEERGIIDGMNKKNTIRHDIYWWNHPKIVLATCLSYLSFCPIFSSFSFSRWWRTLFPSFPTRCSRSLSAPSSKPYLCIWLRGLQNYSHLQSLWKVAGQWLSGKTLKLLSPPQLGFLQLWYTYPPLQLAYLPISLSFEQSLCRGRSCSMEKTSIKELEN
jgi:hypothetical protein